MDCFNTMMLVNNTVQPDLILNIFFDFWLTVKAAPHECIIRTGQP